MFSSYFRFTPACEVELCGHATLAAAHVLYETKTVALGDSIHFHTKFSGELIAKAAPDMTIELTFPETPVEAVTLTAELKDALLSAIGIEESDILYTGKSIYDHLIEVKPEAFYGIKKVIPSSFEKFGGRGVLITTLGGKRYSHPNSLNYDFLSRGFFPLYGIPEDPFTGSAHCALANYWFAKFNIKREEGKRTEALDAFQASARGGAVKVSIINDRVILGGKGITTMTCKVLV